MTVDLDKWSAESLMGWRLSGTGWWISGGKERNQIAEMRQEDWHPSSKDAPAWQIGAVIMAMRKGGWFLNLFTSATDKRMWQGNIPMEANCYTQFFRYPESNGQFESETIKDSEENINTAILKAAYAAKEGK